MAESWLQPGALVRFGVIADDGSGEVQWFPFFTGTVEAMPESTAENVDAQVTLDLVETTADLGGWFGETQALTGAGDTLEERVLRLTADANWQAPVDVLPDSVGDIATYQDTTLSDNRLQEVDKVATAVGMIVLAGSDGGLVLASRHPDQAAHSDEVFSNKPAGAEYPVVSVAPYASTDRIANAAVMQRVGGLEQGYVDTHSQQRYGRHVHPDSGATDLPVEDDFVVKATVTRLVVQGADDKIGVEGIQLNMDQDNVRLPLLLAKYASTGLTAKTPFNLRWVHPSGKEFTEELVIEGLSMGIVPVEPGGQMLWNASLSTARRYISPAVDAFWDISFWDATNWAFVA